MKTVKEIIEDLQSQYAHYSYWFFKEPDGIWDKLKQVEHDKICVDKHCILKVFKHKKTIIIDDIYNELRIQTKHISFWFVKGWSKENGKKHNQECQNKHCN